LSIIAADYLSFYATAPTNKHHLQILFDKDWGYSLWSLEEVRNKLLEWQPQYPEFAQVTLSQDAFGLPAAGNQDGCPFDEGIGCRNYSLTIQD
jgi:hypothetical protein